MAIAIEMAAQTDDIEIFAKAVIERGDVLSQTPEMLPVLKQAGVVDSGGQGLMQVVKGVFDGLTGKCSDFSFEDAGILKPSSEKALSLPELPERILKAQRIDRFSYCTEFIIKLEKEYSQKDEDELKKYLGSIGDSLVVVSDDEIVKIHVHTNHPGLAFERTYLRLSFSYEG